MTGLAENLRGPDDMVEVFDCFGDFGFAAAMTLKGPWRTQSDVYRFVMNNILPSGLTLVIPEQVHGSDVIFLGDMAGAFNFKADAVITRRKDICLSVTTADCLPLLLADPVSGHFGVVHIGWRSLVTGILDNFMHIALANGMDIAQTRGFSGPAIGPCCFEVGPEVAALFGKEHQSLKDGSIFVDLRNAVENELLSLGITKSNMSGLLECTSCDDKKYYSFRRDRQSPVQMVTFIYKSAV